MSDLGDVMAELAHPIEGKWQNPIEIAKAIAGEYNRMVGKSSRYNHYNDPSHYEYRTHRIVEPALWDYVMRGKDTDYIKQN